jgi:hypothetical protein
MINRAIIQAYEIMKIRNWDTIYWAIDLHGVCFPSTYTSGKYQFVNSDCIKALQLISSRPESKIILWSSCFPSEQPAILEFFKQHNISVHSFNSNTEVQNTQAGCFDTKFYFNILVDDKAGFNPERDWENVISLLTHVV